MGMPKKTAIQLARSLGVDIRDVLKAMRQKLGLAGRDPKWSLSPHQCDKIRDYLAQAGTLSEDEEAGEADTAVEPAPAAPAVALRPDPPSESGEFHFGDLNHGLWLHPDVHEAVAGMEDLRKRLGIVLQHLGAHGRTTVVKSCRDQTNRGWLRSPLGGNGGMQYYLWWAPQGSAKVDSLDLAGRDILVRSVRHHDDHSPLEAGPLRDYISIRQSNLEDDDLVGCPWTEEQLEFVESGDPVRFVLGRPGSGKTTVLWKAIEARGDQRVLYLTWSRELSRVASERFRAFAPVGVDVQTRDFATFLGAVCRVDIVRQPLAQSHAIFEEATRKLGPRVLGPWDGRTRALFAEIRGYLLGGATRGEDDCAVADTVRLSDAEYLRRRGDREGIGRAPAESVLKVVRAIGETTAFATIFPELVAAAQGIERLRKDDLPEGFAGFDRVVVDEVQDLTLLEATAVVELCRAIARHKGSAPWLLMAGDDGQTVRPSGFAWGPLSDLVARRVAPPTRFDLRDNLRCPKRIAAVIDRASAKYGSLEKGRRPTKQGQRAAGEHVEARLFHVETASSQEAVDLLEQLEDVEGVVVVSPEDEVPAWVPAHLRDMVLMPAEAKGLEYQSVCIIDPGALLVRLDNGPVDVAAAELQQHERRTTIDQLRVALSRATETLAFLDVEPDEAERTASESVLGDAAPFDPEDLAEYFTDADVPVDDQVRARINDARALIEERPRRAWRRAYQALRLLGDPALPNGVLDDALRREVQVVLLATAARLLVDGVPAGTNRRDVVSAAREAARALDSVDAENAIAELDEWSSRKSAPFALLEAIVSLGDDRDWLTAAIASHAQALLQAVERGPGVAATAKEFAGHVEGWLRVVGYAGDATADATRLRCRAVDTLMAAGDHHAAERVLALIQPEDALRTGRVREAQGRLAEAARAFERADATKDALRNWRGAGLWEEAVRLAEGKARADLEWLGELDRLLARRPEGHRDRLTTAERNRLKERLGALR